MFLQQVCTYETCKWRAYGHNMTRNHKKVDHPTVWILYEHCDMQNHKRMQHANDVINCKIIRKCDRWWYIYIKELMSTAAL